MLGFCRATWRSYAYFSSRLKWCCLGTGANACLIRNGFGLNPSPFAKTMNRRKISWVVVTRRAIPCAWFTLYVVYSLRVAFLPIYLLSLCLIVATALHFGFRPTSWMEILRWLKIWRNIVLSVQSELQDRIDATWPISSKRKLTLGWVFHAFVPWNNEGIADWVIFAHINISTFDNNPYINQNTCNVYSAMLWNLHYRLVKLN